MIEEKLNVDSELLYIANIEKTYGKDKLNQCLRIFSGRGSYKNVNDMPPRTIKLFVYWLRDLVEDASSYEQEGSLVTEEKSLTVETPVGTIKVVDAGYDNNPEEYPGVWVEINGVGLVLVEFNPDTQNIRTMIWNKDDEDNDPIAVYQLT